MSTPTAAHRALTGQIDASARDARHAHRHGRGTGTPDALPRRVWRLSVLHAGPLGESNRSDTGGSAPPGTTPPDGAKRGLHDRAEADAQVARVASSGLRFHALATWAVSRGVPIMFSGRLLTIR